MGDLEERKSKINDFLNQVYNNIKKSNSLTANSIYHQLIRYDLPESELGRITKEIFPYWLNKFNNRENVRTFYDERTFGDNFLIFQNFKQPMDVMYHSDPVKIYVAFEHDKLKQNFDKIMEFLTNNNIIHYTKVAKIMRNDMITIRVKEMEDAKKVINFINSFVTDGALLTNPFLMHDGIVGLAVNNFDSYNAKVSELVYDYMNNKLIHNNSNISYDDFVNFTRNYRFPQEKDCPYVYIEEIRKLILLSITSNDLNKFKNHYYSAVRNKDKTMPIEEKQDFLISILYKFVKETVRRHGFECAEESLYKYLNFGDILGLSRIKNEDGTYNRNELKEYSYQEMLEAIKGKYKTDDASKIIKYMMNGNIEKSPKKRDALISVLSEFVQETVKKHGVEFAEE